METRRVRPIKVAEVEISRPLQPLTDLEGYAWLQALVRLHAVPLGYVVVPIEQGRCSPAALAQAILDRHAHAILQHLLEDALAAGLNCRGLPLAGVVNVPHHEPVGPLPSVTVAVCTRDRTENLAPCLEALLALQYPALDLLVVDNAPSSDATETLVRERYPSIRYVREPRPGLNWARNRAIVECRGEILAYTDDDVVVDPSWVKALATVFAENPAVMAVTGLVAPYELDTEAELLFERYGGFGKGFVRGYHVRAMAHFHGSGRFGTGANMAYRRSVFDGIGAFDPALDVGTVTNGGGDLEMFFRLLKEGHLLVYEPAALVFHRHRRERARLKTQLTNHGIGFFACMVRSMLHYPEERLAFLKVMLWWYRWILRRWGRACLRPGSFPRDLITAELGGSFIGLTRYFRARRQAEAIARAQGALLEARPVAPPSAALPPAAAVRLIDVSVPLAALDDVMAYARVQVIVNWKERTLGRVDIVNDHRTITVQQLRHALVQTLGLDLIEPEAARPAATQWALAVTAVAARFGLAGEHEGRPQDQGGLPSSVPVSIVVPTYDRPQDLRGCLAGLLAQRTARPVEILVVDNHPRSGLTPAVTAEFPSVLYLAEPRQGASYARNTGILASRGAIVITVDDDVRLPPGWLEQLLAPFVRDDVMVVTGNILPLELETPAQQLFEDYGGLGRGYRSFTVDGDWFAAFRGAVPTWHLGGTANAAFRASLFRQAEVGLLEESLGAGVPSGCSEDTYLFYKVLKAGHAIAYEPRAYVWHRHRRDVRALGRQIYNYSKGHVAYHLLTVWRDGDPRGLVRLLVQLPVAHLRRLRARLWGWSTYPLWLLLVEIAGNLAGPWALWRSLRYVARQGRSYAPLKLVKEEAPTAADQTPAGEKATLVESEHAL